ncbi:hypothetical protein G6F57_021979 [Rhizopus arrhizus]|nr:hypothetical protein G6F57_021979 [Rhizopus arrhizus]
MAAGAFAQHGRGQQQGEERLGLDDQRGHPCGHAEFQRGEQQAELPQPLHQPVSRDPVPRQLRPAHEEDQGEGRQRKPQRAEHHGGQAPHADLHDNKIQPPDDHDRQCAEIVFSG